jgi:biotin operon repressor
MALLCHGCGKRLEPDEVSINRRFGQHDDTTFLCIGCLAERYKCPRSAIETMIEHLKQTGCSFFR